MTTVAPLEVLRAGPPFDHPTGVTPAESKVLLDQPLRHA